MSKPNYHPLMYIRLRMWAEYKIKAGENVSGYHTKNTIKTLMEYGIRIQSSGNNTDVIEQLGDEIEAWVKEIEKTDHRAASVLRVDYGAHHALVYLDNKNCSDSERLDNLAKLFGYRISLTTYNQSLQLAQSNISTFLYRYYSNTDKCNKKSS